MELKVKDANADSGAQITIVPAHLLSQSGIKIEGLRQSKIDLRAANNAKINVQGVADAKISGYRQVASDLRRQPGYMWSTTSVRSIFPSTSSSA